MLLLYLLPCLLVFCHQSPLRICCMWFSSFQQPMTLWGLGCDLASGTSSLSLGSLLSRVQMTQATLLPSEMSGGHLQKTTYWNLIFFCQADKRRTTANGFMWGLSYIMYREVPSKKPDMQTATYGKGLVLNTVCVCVLGGVLRVLTPCPLGSELISSFSFSSCVLLSKRGFNIPSLPCTIRWTSVFGEILLCNIINALT